MVEHPRLGQGLRDVAAKAADRAFLDGDQRLVMGGKLKDQAPVQRFGKAGVGDCHGHSARGQGLRRRQRLTQPGAERQDRHPRPFA